MRLSHALSALPTALVLGASVAVALGHGSPRLGRPVLKAGIDLGSARAALLAIAPVGTLADVAMARMRGLGLTCRAFEPPMANLTWSVIRCSAQTSPEALALWVDVAGRNGVLADIGVEDASCASRADVTRPDPEPGGCDLAGRRLLDIEAARRAARSALLVDALKGR
jgi:hypothetical protein